MCSTMVTKETNNILTLIMVCVSAFANQPVMSDPYMKLVT